MTTTRKYTHNELWKAEHIIDGMIYCNDIEKWVTVEEYTDYYYAQKIQYKYEQSKIIII